MKRLISVLVCTAALAATTWSLPTAGATGSPHIDLQARGELIRAAVDAETHGNAPSATLETAEFGDCGEAEIEDPDEGVVIDIGLAFALADCDGTIAAGVFTYDAWTDDELGVYVVLVDTDENGTTGCDGFEYSVGVVYTGSGFEGRVFRESTSCAEPVDVGPALGGRSDPDFIAMQWDLAAIGNPSSFAFTSVTVSMDGSSFDDAPEPGGTQPVIDISGQPTRPPANPPAARPIAPGCTFPGGFEDGFRDVAADSSHEAAIDCIVYWQVTSGVREGVYAPSGNVTREQMASFLARFIERSGGVLPESPPNAFPDDDGSAHEANIDKLAAAGIVGGRIDGSFGPRAVVTRAQMATFIVRTLEHRLEGPLAESSSDFFTDDAGDVHEANINAAAAAGITGGVGGTSFGPLLSVRRDQMASFLARGLAELVDRGVATIPDQPAS